MKGSNITQVPVQAVRFMKLAGIILVLFTIINYVLLLFPLNIGDQEWTIDFIETVVQQGIVPILGMALIFCAFAFEEVLGLAPPEPKLKWDGLKFWLYLGSSFFGIIFLLLIPWHISNAVGLSNQAIEQVNQTAVEEEKILEQRLAEQETVINSMFQDNQKLEEYIRQEQLSDEELANIEKFKKNPNALKLHRKEVSSRLTKQIENKRQQNEQRLQMAAFQSSLKIGLTSLLLASCYLTIGWSGFRGKPRRVRK